MRLMTAEGTVTRTELSLPDFEFGTLDVSSANEGVHIARNGWGPGDVSFRRVTTTSVYVPGRVLVHSVPDVQQSVLKLRVQGSSQSDMQVKLSEVIAAFTQFSYTLSVNVNGKVWEYLCETADYSVGDAGNVDDLMLRSKTQYITLNIPHSPVDTGSYVGTGTHPIIE